MHRLLCPAVIASVFFSCGGGGPADAGPDAGPVDAGSDALTADERDVVDRGGDSSNASQQLTVLANELFDFDPTIDPAKTAAENAAAVELRVRNNLGAPDGGVAVDGGSLGCGTVSLSGTTVTVAYGPAPGCTMRSRAVISGTAAVAVTKTGTTITLGLTLTQVVINGVGLAGSASFATTNGTSFTVNANITSGTTTYVVTNLSATGGSGSTTVNGAVTVGTGDAVTTTTYTNLVWNLGDCYPRGGTLSTKKGLITTVVTFDANTPTTGLVKVTVGRKSSTVTLPAYGQCGARDAGP